MMITKLLLLLTLLTFSETASATWPTEKELYLSCFYRNADGLKSFQGKIVQEVRAYCRCRTRHIKNYHKFTKVMPPKVVLDYLMLQINFQCSATKST